MINPECEREDCRFQQTSPGMTTCMYYPPIYDKYGNNTNPDMNITTYNIKCSVCEKEFHAREQAGNTTYTSVEKD